MNAPRFWYQKQSRLGKILSPLGRVYDVLGRIRRVLQPVYRAKIPVCCVGNIAVGGCGKTPVCLALGRLLQEQGQSYFFLNHGYKSKKQGVQVRGPKDVAVVGDEAVLLAAQAPTIVNHRRDKGARLAWQKGAKALIMDDGFQNARLKKDISFVVIDGQRGFGNGFILPAGPLRESPLQGLRRATAVIIAGKDTAGAGAFVRRYFPKLPILTGAFVQDEKSLQPIRGKAVFAFTGIGHPQKFFDMLKKNGVKVERTRTFADHYYYTAFDLQDMRAQAPDLPFVTTEKDAVKLPDSFLKHTTVVKGNFIFDEPQKVLDILRQGGFLCQG